jgi:CheY-like chemotaxis protein
MPKSLRCARTIDPLVFLRADGHEVLVADSGPAGLQAALSETPDVVLMDLGLPGIGGFEVARRIREKTDKPLLIAMTGYGQVGDKQHSKEAGFQYHLVKPVDPVKLQSLLIELSNKEPSR